MSVLSIAILVGFALFGWALPVIGLVLLIVLGAMYVNRYFNPIPTYAITKKLDHCIIAHRAGTANAETIVQNIDGSSPGGSISDKGIVPENTLLAFRAAKELGLKSVEFDVRMTLDGIAVVFHDDTVGNTLQVPPTDINKSISEFTFKEIQSFPLREERCSFPNERIPRLDDVLALCRDLELLMMIEIKQQGNLLRRCCEQIAYGIEANKVFDLCYVASFNPLALYYTRAVNNRICTGYLYAASASSAIAAELKKQNTPLPLVLRIPLLPRILDYVLRSLGTPLLLKLFGHSIAAVDAKYVSPQLVEEYKRHGVTVLVWTVNDAAQQDYLFNTLKVSVITDAPPLHMVTKGSDFAS